MIRLFILVCGFFIAIPLCASAQKVQIKLYDFQYYRDGVLQKFDSVIVDTLHFNQKKMIHVADLDPVSFNTSFRIKYKKRNRIKLKKKSFNRIKGFPRRTKGKKHRHRFTLSPATKDELLGYLINGRFDYQGIWHRVFYKYQLTYLHIP